MWCEFSLPAHKTLDQTELTPEEKKKLGGADRERDIVAIGKTINEMEKQLPSRWKPLWKQRNENQAEKGETQ